MKKYSQESGFALLMTLIVVGVVLSIGMSILDLSIKQVKLSSNAKESEIAFHAANAGMECARYWRRASTDDMEIGNPISPFCFDVNPPDTNTVSEIVGPSNIVGDGKAFMYRYSFTWGPAGDYRCTQVDNMIASSSSSGAGVTVKGMSSFFPGWPTATAGPDSYCEPGSRCTVISARGYNRPCSTATGYGTIEREVLLQF